MPKSVIDDMKSHMEKTVSVLKGEFQKIRTGRASTGILDAVKVDYYGNPSSISLITRSIAALRWGVIAGGSQAFSTATGLPRRVITISWPASASPRSREKA